MTTREDILSLAVPVLWQAWRSNDWEAEDNPDWVEFDDEESARAWGLACLFNGVRPLYAAPTPPAAEAPGQEPVAWRYRYNGRWYACDSEAFARNGHDVTPLYAAPTPPAAEARPFGWARGVHQPSTPNGPAEYDVDFLYGDDMPFGDGWFPVYREPPAAEAPGQEPVAWLVEHAHSGPVLSWKPPTAGAEALGWAGTPLYPAPPTYADAEAKGYPEDLVALIETELMAWRGANGGIHAIKAAATSVSIMLRAAAIRSLASPAPKGET